MSIIPIRVAVQSRRRLVRDALAGCLASRPDFTVVGRTARCSDLPDLCLLRRPDALLVEASGPEDNRAEAISAVHLRYPATNIVVVYQSLTPAEMVRAYGSGITSLVPYSRGLDTVVAALKARPTGGSERDPVTSRRSPAGSLTDRELEIMALICAGHSVREVAGTLGISPRTVENHKRRIYDKLGVHSQSQAVAQAAQLGLVLPPAGTPDPVRVDPGDVPAVVAVRGPAGPVRDAVARALADGGVAFSVERAESAPVPARITVLVDPGPDDWSRPGAAAVVVVHAGPADQARTVDAVLRGADAIVPADRIADRLVPVLAVVREGCLAMDGAQARDFFRALRARLGPTPPSTPESVLPELTGREHDILCSIARGDTVRQTARSLGISVKTVENTQGRLFRKLGARNRAGALAVAYGFGLISPEPPDAAADPARLAGHPHGAAL